MGQPKKRTSSRKSGMRRSHLVLKLARQVNSKSPVKAHTTLRENGKPVQGTAKSSAAKSAKKPAKTA